MEVSSQSPRTLLGSVVRVVGNLDRFLAQAIENIVQRSEKLSSILNCKAEAEVAMGNQQ
jgi:hypothetical protein